MKLQHITFTGVDGKTDLGELWELELMTGSILIRFVRYWKYASL